MLDTSTRVHHLSVGCTADQLKVHDVGDVIPLDDRQVSTVKGIT